MKITLTIILTVLAFQLSIGQVAIIQDLNGWTNVRNAPNGESEIIHKVHENEVFWFDYDAHEKKQNWISIYIPKNDFCLGKSEENYIVGYIHKSKLLPLEALKSYTGNDFSFEYKLSEFNLANKIVDKQEGKWVAAIDGRPVWGTDGNFPKTQVDDIEVSIDGIKITIHKVFYSDIYECDNEFSVFKNGETYFVHQWNSDGAGAYEIVWAINKNGLKQRLVGTII